MPKSAVKLVSGELSRSQGLSDRGNDAARATAVLAQRVEM